MHNPILALRHIVQEAAVASTPQKRIQGIVSQVKAAMQVGACALYLADDEGVLTLAATDGLNPDSVGRIRLRSGEGLVGRIAQTQHPLNVEKASEHPLFCFFPDSGEECYEGFLGAPVVHGGRLVGVLVVEQRARRRFSEEEESFLVTVAAHLGSANPADLRLEESSPDGLTGGRPTRRIKGIRGAPGVGIGRARILFDGSDLMTVPDSEAEDVASEREHFCAAVEAVIHDLAEGQRKLSENVSAEVADVFEIYKLLLRSDEFSGAVERGIAAGGAAAGVLRAVVSACAERFEEMDDPYLRARAEDIRNLGHRVYARLREADPVSLGEGERVVLVGGLVSIADIAAHPIEQLAGLVSLGGSSLSHTAVLAKALGLPAVMGAGPLGDLPDGESIIVDGYQGQVILRPPPPVEEEFRRLIDFEQALLSKLAQLKTLPAETRDGVRVNLYANTGLLADISPGLAHGAEGIGLYRSEIPFMVRESFPSEEEQVEVYRTVLESYSGLPVVMRTLDVGGDKPLPYYPVREENPALGWRGVRFTLDHSAVFMTQIRAMLRASRELDNLHIMLPMVSSLREVESFCTLLDSACHQLAEEGTPVTRPRIGVMAEVPAIVSMLPFMGARIDFVSIGSNDLTQYLLAVDRDNPRVTELFDHLHPAVLQTVEEIARRANDLGITAGVCGEMAADPCAAVLLLGMGIRSFSMSAFDIPRIKWLIRSISCHSAREQLEMARQCAHPGFIRERLRSFLVDHGLGALLEPESPGEGALETPGVPPPG